MDFKLVLEKLLKAFDENGIQYALMGGFALGLLGVGRTTIDMDFLVALDDMEKVDALMRQLGYECRHKSKDVSQYVSPLKVFGEVDFLHAFRETSIEMLRRAEEKKIFDSMKIKVLIPEDIIGLKLQAMKNNPERHEMDAEDVIALMRCYRDTMNWALIERYVKILEMEELYKELCKKQ